MSCSADPVGDSRGRVAGTGNPTVLTTLSGLVSTVCGLSPDSRFHTFLIPGRPLAEQPLELELAHR